MITVLSPRLASLVSRMHSRVVMGTRSRYSVWRVYPPQMSQTISAAKKSSSVSPQVLSLSRKPNGQRQRIDYSQRRNYVPNSKRTRHSWERMKPPNLHPPIQIRVPCMQPLRRHMLLHQHRPLLLQFLLGQWFPQVRPRLPWHATASGRFPRSTSLPAPTPRYAWHASWVGRLRLDFIHVLYVYLTLGLRPLVSLSLQVSPLLQV